MHFKTEAMPFFFIYVKFCWSTSSDLYSFSGAWHEYPYGTENEQKFIPPKYLRIFLSVHGTSQWNSGDGSKRIIKYILNLVNSTLGKSLYHEKQHRMITFRYVFTSSGGQE